MFCLPKYVFFPAFSNYSRILILIEIIFFVFNLWAIIKKEFQYFLNEVVKINDD